MKSFFRNLKRIGKLNNQTGDNPVGNGFLLSTIDIFTYYLEQFPIDLEKLSTFTRGCVSEEFVGQFIKENSLSYLSEISSPKQSISPLPVVALSSKQVDYLKIPLAEHQISQVKSNSSVSQVNSPSNTYVAALSPVDQQFKGTNSVAAEGKNIANQIDNLSAKTLYQGIDQPYQSTTNHLTQPQQVTNRLVTNLIETNSVSHQNFLNSVSLKQLYEVKTNNKDEISNQSQPLFHKNNEIMSLNPNQIQGQYHFTLNNQKEIVNDHFSSIEGNTYPHPLVSSFLPQQNLLASKYAINQICGNDSSSAIEPIQNRQYDYKRPSFEINIPPIPETKENTFNTSNLLQLVRSQIGTIKSHNRMFEQLASEPIMFRESPQKIRDSDQNLPSERARGTFVFDLFHQMKKSLKNVVVYAHKDQRKASMFLIEKDLQNQKNLLKESFAQFQVTIQQENYKPSTAKSNPPPPPIIPIMTSPPTFKNQYSLASQQAIPHQPQTLSSKYMLSRNTSAQALEPSSDRNSNYKSPSHLPCSNPQVNEFQFWDKTNYGFSSFVDDQTTTLSQPKQFTECPLPINIYSTGSNNPLISSNYANIVHENNQGFENKPQFNNVPIYDNYNYFKQNGIHDIHTKEYQSIKHLYIENKKIY